MTTLQYEDNNCRQKQIQKEKEEYALKVVEFYHNRLFYIKKTAEQLQFVIDLYKEEQNGKV
jgi:hypothetical protein